MKRRHVKLVAIAGVVLALVIAGVLYGIERRNAMEAARLHASQRKTPSSPRTTEPDERFVTARGGKLYRHGKPFRFHGVNVFSALSRPRSEGYPCGRTRTGPQARAMVNEVAAVGNAVRLMVFQSFLQDPRDPGKLDFSRLDAVIAEADARGVLLILVLENQWGDCTQGGYKWSSWYGKGYRAPYGRYRLSFREFVRQVVTRYKDEPAIMMWQLINEAESRDKHGPLEDAEQLFRFLQDMAQVVERADPNHLLSSGVANIDAPGSGGPYYPLLHQVRGIDVVDAHDYGADFVANPLRMRRAATVARKLGKPFFIGEVGVPATDLIPKAKRARLVMQKVSAAWKNGVAGILVWSYHAGAENGYDFGPRDPLYAKLREFSRISGIRDQE